MRQIQRNPTLALIVLPSLTVALAGCGSGSSYATPGPPSPPVIQNASIAGQYNLVLASTNGHGKTYIYSNFVPTGTTFVGGSDTLVCPSNDVLQCKGDDASGTPITPNGTVSGAHVTISIVFPSATEADTITMVGTATPQGLAGTYTDSRGDSGTWTASHPVNGFTSSSGVSTYTGTFNSTSHPLAIAPTIHLQLGVDTSAPSTFTLTGTAAVMNSPCISSLTFSGRAIGEAFRLTDSANGALIIALPVEPPGPIYQSFNFAYKFGPAAASCAGDFGQGAVTADKSPWDY